MFGDSIIASLLWMVIVVGAVIVLAWWFTRHVAGRGVFGAAVRLGGGMDVLAQLPMGSDQRLVMVQVGERFFLLGVTAAQITALAEFTEEEVGSWKHTPESPGDPPPPAFWEAFSKVLQKNRRR